MHISLYMSAKGSKHVCIPGPSIVYQQRNYTTTTTSSLCQQRNYTFVFRFAQSEVMKENNRSAVGINYLCRKVQATNVIDRMKFYSSSAEQFSAETSIN